MVLESMRSGAKEVLFPLVDRVGRPLGLDDIIELEPCSERLSIVSAYCDFYFTSGD